MLYSPSASIPTHSISQPISHIYIVLKGPDGNWVGVGVTGGVGGGGIAEQGAVKQSTISCSESGPDTNGPPIKLSLSS